VLFAQGLGLLFEEGLQGAFGEPRRGGQGDVLHGGEVDVEPGPLVAEGPPGDNLAPLGGEAAEFVDLCWGKVASCL
jgi:hypothetical protein